MKGMLLFGSMICFYGSYLGMCTRSTNNYINQLRGQDSPVWAFAALLVVLLGSFLLYLMRRLDGGGDLKRAVLLGLAGFTVMFIYGHSVASDMITIDLKDYVKAPVVEGYEREGYVAEGPSLDWEHVNALLESTDDEEDRAHLEYLFESSGFSYTIYEDFQNFEGRRDGCIHNGDEISVSFDFDKEFAEKYHIAFDNIYINFDVDGLPEEPERESSFSRNKLIDIVLDYEHSIGSSANMGEVGAEFDNGDVEIITSYIEGDTKTPYHYYRINSDSLELFDEMTGTRIEY